MQIIMFASKPLDLPPGTPDKRPVRHPVRGFRCQLVFLLPVAQQTLPKCLFVILASQLFHDPRGNPAQPARFRRNQLLFLQNHVRIHLFPGRQEKLRRGMYPGRPALHFFPDLGFRK